MKHYIISVLLIIGVSSVVNAWDIEIVDDSSDGSCSITLDSNNLPHICYENDGLRYAFLIEDEWNYETPGSPLGRHSVIEIDDSSIPHLYYTDSNFSASIRYAWKDEFGWNNQIVWGGGMNGWGAKSLDLSLGSDGMLHANNDYYISFDFPPFTVWGIVHRCLSDTGWTEETLIGGSGGNQLLYSSMDLDTLDHPHITYAYQGLKYISKDDFGTWNDTEIIDTAHPYGISLSLNPDDQPCMSYATYYTGIVKYAFKDDRGWNIEIIDDMNESDGTSMVLDENNIPHIVYHITNTEDLMYAYRSANGWVVECVDTIGAVGAAASLGIDATGVLHLVYHDETNSVIKYATRDLPPILCCDGDVSGNQFVITWNPVPAASQYGIYGAVNHNHFNPGLPPDNAFRVDVLPSGSTSWSSSNGIGDPDNNWTYLVIAMDASEQEIVRSNRVGELDFGMEIQ